jgi:hypothetical protein
MEPELYGWYASWSESVESGPLHGPSPIQTSSYSAIAHDRGGLENPPDSIIQRRNADRSSASILGHSPDALIGSSPGVSDPQQPEDWLALMDDDAGRYSGVETMGRRSEERQQVGRIRISTA